MRGDVGRNGASPGFRLEATVAVTYLREKPISGAYCGSRKYGWRLSSSLNSGNDPESFLVASGSASGCATRQMKSVKEREGANF